MQIVRCSTDCCGFFWNGKEQDIHTFSANGSRASEFEGAVMNVQLDRIDDTIATMRKSKKDILRRTTASGIAQGQPETQPRLGVRHEDLLSVADIHGGRGVCQGGRRRDFRQDRPAYL